MPSLTITMDATQAQRLTVAFTAKTGIQNPSMDDLKAFLVVQLRSMVHRYERDIAVNTQIPFNPS